MTQPILNSIRIIAIISIPANTFLITVADDRRVSFTPTKDRLLPQHPVE